METDGIDGLTLGPALALPIGFLEYGTYSNSCVAVRPLERQHQLRVGHRGRKHAKQVDMVRLDVHLHDLASELAAEDTNAIVHVGLTSVFSPGLTLHWLRTWTRKDNISRKTNIIRRSKEKKTRTK